ncbi:hypothetical protein ACIGC1_27540 [Peribacillus butanolivorans]|uniref:hypothetical protein n=1 Tax=Peribacillus butanolivorans TaxID=421767 RepID=UPI0037CA8E40
MLYRPFRKFYTLRELQQSSRFGCSPFVFYSFDLSILIFRFSARWYGGVTRTVRGYRSEATHTE